MTSTTNWPDRVKNLEADLEDTRAQLSATHLIIWCLVNQSGDHAKAPNIDRPAKFAKISVAEALNYGTTGKLIISKPSLDNKITIIAVQPEEAS